MSSHKLRLQWELPKEKFTKSSYNIHISHLEHYSQYCFLEVLWMSSLLFFLSRYIQGIHLMLFRKHLSTANALLSCSSINIQLCGKQAAMSEMNVVMKSRLSGLCKHIRGHTHEWDRVYRGPDEQSWRMSVRLIDSEQNWNNYTTSIMLLFISFVCFSQSLRGIVSHFE